MNIVAVNHFCCRRCVFVCSSNNQFHKYLRSATCIKFFSKSNINLQKVVLTRFSSNSMTYSDNVEESNSQVENNISLIRFKINSNTDIKIEYEFKEWQYAIANVSLFSNVKSNSSCIDFEAEITFVDEFFFKEKTKNISIKTMTISIFVRELSTTKHIIDKYVILFMYFESVNDSDKSAKAIIIREVHLIKDFKAHLLIENDVLKSKMIDISNSTNSIYIESCNITISINTKSRFKAQTKSVHALKVSIISVRLKCLIAIHSITFLSNKDFLFESFKTSNFVIYAHLLNLYTSFIFVRNDHDQNMKILRNLRLSTTTELKYFNAYSVNFENVFDLILRHLKSTHKSLWFEKVVSTFSTIASNNKIDSANDFVLFNEIVIHNSSQEVVKALTDLIDEYSNLWIDQEFADLSMKNWMRISLRSDWENKIKDKIKIYSMKTKNRQILNDTFDKLHKQNKLSWTTKSTLFFFSCFVVWRKSFEQKKNRVIVDIRKLNVVVQSDAYSVSLQSDILTTVSDCDYISVIDCSEFFYQWRVHSKDRHKLTIVTHRDQKFFNVAVMSYRNSSAYVQRQIDKVLRNHQRFVKTYVNDIVIFFRTLQDHVMHLKQVFKVLTQNNISINSIKTFLEFSFVNLLKQHVTSLKLSTNEQKLRTITNLTFSRNLTQLETYLRLTEWFRQYIDHYAVKSESLQLRKIRLLKLAFKSDNAKKIYTIKIILHQFSNDEINVFETLQRDLFKSIYLIHFDFAKQLYADLNFSDAGMSVMIYHVKSSCEFVEYLFRNCVQSIIFLSRFLTSIETRYWFTELELAEFVWILRKIRHLVKSTRTFIIIYIDHEIALRIAQQISLITSSTDKLNLRLIRVSKYIQKFSLQIRHKSEKLNIVSNALFRLFSVKSEIFDNINDEELNVFHATSVEMNAKFKAKILQEYKENPDWIKISKVLNNSSHFVLLFIRENELIYRKETDTDITSFLSRRVCAFFAVLQDIFDIIHDFNDHSDFDKSYELIMFVWYIRDLIKHFKHYLKHCSKCQINQTRKHKSFESLQFILSSSTLFYVITIDFVLVISSSHTELNNVMSVTCKFSKKITIVLEKDIWTAKDWVTALLKRFDLIDWNLFKIIISDRNRKFLFDLWTELFSRLDAKLLYSTAYHSQIDESSKRINQIFEIALRYHIQTFENVRNWLTIVSIMQRVFNNSSISIEKSSNEICYEFTSLRSTDLILQYDSRVKSLSIKHTVENSIAHSQMLVKQIYDDKHKLIELHVDDWALLRLHKDYNISFTKILEKKLSQQYASSFKILKRVRNLAYRIDISSHWRIWFVVSISQLKSCFASDTDSYNKIMRSSKSIIMKSDTDTVKFYEIQKIIAKRSTTRDVEYFVRWLEYESKHDVWRNLSKLQNAMNLMKDFDALNALNTIREHALNATRRRERFKKFWCLHSSIDESVDRFLFETVVTLTILIYSLHSRSSLLLLSWVFIVCSIVCIKRRICSIMFSTCLRPC